MKIVFMGTPELAAVILEDMLAAKEDIIAVVTQTDKPKGRGKEMAISAVKEVALKHDIPVYQPMRAKDEAFIAEMAALNPDMIVVAAYGKILPKAILDMPKYGCINVHTSLLPKYRGSAPINWVVIDGEEKTGVTIMHMDEGIDTGDMILKVEVPIEKKETAGTLHDKLAKAGSKALLEALGQIKAGTAKREKQDDSLSSYVKMLDKQLGNIDFNKSAVEIERLIRGLNPWPSAFTSLGQKTLKIWDADVCEDEELVKQASSMENGTVAFVQKNTFYIKTGDGLLQINELQLEGKKRMHAGDFLRGVALEAGTKLG
ncbi:MAG: methionyl-tRNA formyltransferase [Lachnospiraceae bacterium]|nr:methionyl-tRNA formyltransferase [Lachnospiraceae bacterium]